MALLANLVVAVDWLAILLHRVRFARVMKALGARRAPHTEAARLFIALAAEKLPARGGTGTARTGTKYANPLSRTGTHTLYSNTGPIQMHPTPGQLHTAVELETSREPDDTRRQKCMTLIANWWMGAVRSENCRFNLRRLSQNALVRARVGRSARSHSAARPSCHGISARPSVQHAARARQASDGFLLSW